MRQVSVRVTRTASFILLNTDGFDFNPWIKAVI